MTWVWQTLEPSGRPGLKQTMAAGMPGAQPCSAECPECFPTWLRGRSGECLSHVSACCRRQLARKTACCGAFVYNERAQQWLGQMWAWLWAIPSHLGMTISHRSPGKDWHRKWLTDIPHQGLRALTAVRHLGLEMPPLLIQAGMAQTSVRASCWPGEGVSTERV